VARQHFFCLTCHEREVTSLSAPNSLRPSTCFIASGAAPFIFIAPRNLITEYTQHLVYSLIQQLSQSYATTVNRLVQTRFPSLPQSDKMFKQILITSGFIYIRLSVIKRDFTTVSLLIPSHSDVQFYTVKIVLYTLSKFNHFIKCTQH
jgi:hypothetical protein